MISPFRMFARINTVTPTMGEEIGHTLRKAADDYTASRENNPLALVGHWGPVAAQLYDLAAAAYKTASEAAFGHNRAARCMDHSTECAKLSEVWRKKASTPDNGD